MPFLDQRVKIMSEYNQDVLEIELTAEQCKSCPNVVSLEQIDKNYQGVVATYADDKCCTLDCMGDLQHAEN